MLDEEDSELRVRVLSGLARALANRGEQERGGIARQSAIAMARRLDDRYALATVLMRSYWARGINTLEEILEMLTEAEALGAELGDIEIQAEAREWRLAALIKLGKLEEARLEAEVVSDLANRMGQPFILHVVEQYASTIAVAQGRLYEAEASAARSHDWSRLLTGRDASGVYGIQMFSLRREQGRLAELAPVIRVLAAGDRWGAWSPGLVALLAELGMDDEVRGHLSRMALDGLGSLRESPWLASLTYLADASSVVGSEEMAALVYPELEVYGGENVMVGYGVACYGATDRYLGMLAATLGEWDVAEQRLRCGARAQRPDGGLDVARAHGLRVWPDAACAGAPRGPPQRHAAPLGGCSTCGADRHARASEPDPSSQYRADRDAEPPRRTVPARGPDRRADRARVVEPGDRERARDQRAHGGEPRSRHPAQDRLCQPDRGCLVCPPAGPRRQLSRRATIRLVPLYLIERTFAEQLNLTAEDVELIEEINADEGVRWLFSFLSADRRRSYCLYEAPSPEAIMLAAERANVPADAIVEVAAGTPAFSGRLEDWAKAQAPSI